MRTNIIAARPTPPAALHGGSSGGRTAWEARAHPGGCVAASRTAPCFSGTSDLSGERVRAGAAPTLAASPAQPAAARVPDRGAAAAAAADAPRVKSEGFYGRSPAKAASGFGFRAGGDAGAGLTGSMRPSVMVGPASAVARPVQDTCQGSGVCGRAPSAVPRPADGATRSLRRTPA